MTLGEVLALDVLRRANPQVVVGAELLDRPVRWVHTSELAEAAYLLRGGEMLLTTGLGITGRGAVGEAAYVAALAARGVAALALELGWTFPEPPRALVDACSEHGLPLLVLREVVPFVEITEHVQTTILERAAGRERSGRDVRQVLTDALLEGAGPQELSIVLCDLVSAPVVVTTAEGALVAAAGGGPDGSGRRGRPVARRDVVLLDRLWGHVAVLPPARADDPLVPAACGYGAEALGLALLRSAAGADLDVRRRQLVDDLTQRRWRAPGELVARARVLGLPFTADGRYAALVITDLPADELDAVVRAVAGALAPGTALVADVGEDVVAVVRTSAVTAAAREVLRAVDALGPPSARVVTGTVVGRLEDVDRSIARARAAQALTSDGDRVVSAADMTARLLLAGVCDGPLARQLVQEEIGRLLDYDAAHGSELVRTLRVYLAYASSKVQTAQALRLRRQTLYGRLQRIEDLIGDISAPHRHTALVLAIALDESAG
ncbi:MAG: PucR family transcriptional regulator ligand-binding domain-containing protein [Actinomycetota bacterium]|nr:PucR family transcriptional regulator ligand-binding domain-containing protein [Actinomycetota bacterium]